MAQTYDIYDAEGRKMLKELSDKDKSMGFLDFFKGKLTPKDKVDANLFADKAGKKFPVYDKVTAVGSLILFMAQSGSDKSREAQAIKQRIKAAMSKMGISTLPKSIVSAMKNLQPKPELPKKAEAKPHKIIKGAAYEYVIPNTKEELKSALDDFDEVYRHIPVQDRFKTANALYKKAMLLDSADDAAQSDGIKDYAIKKNIGPGIIEHITIRIQKAPVHLSPEYENIQQNLQGMGIKDFLKRMLQLDGRSGFSYEDGEESGPRSIMSPFKMLGANSTGSGTARVIVMLRKPSGELTDEGRNADLLENAKKMLASDSKLIDKEFLTNLLKNPERIKELSPDEKQLLQSYGK